jgi:hypothetical protein
MYNDTIEFDFSKTITDKIIGIDDSVTGAVMISSVEVKAENSSGKPELVIMARLTFMGHTIKTTHVDQIVDAFGFEHNLEFARGNMERVAVLPQNNSMIEVEGNITMPDKSPFITKILSSSASRINSVNIVPANDKIMIEGVMATQVVYECEEKQTHAHPVQVPFSTTLKIDGVSTTHTLQAFATIMSVSVKARRGRELLVDARIGVNISATSIETQTLLVDITAGEIKPSDDSAMVIYIVGENETLWDIAKRISCRSAEIIAQNPHAQEGLKMGEKIFIYRQQVVSF